MTRVRTNYTRACTVCRERGHNATTCPNRGKPPKPKYEVVEKGFCAVCTSTRGPFTREPIGANDAIVSVCSACSQREVVPREASAARRGPVYASMRDAVGLTRAERLKANRDSLRARGLCVNGAGHEPPIEGRAWCEDCRAGVPVAQRRKVS
jgi:hypothetical protein